MNGEFAELLSAIKIELAVISKEREIIRGVRDKQHDENTELFNKIFSKMMCDTHAERMRGITARVNLVFVIIGATGLALLGVVLNHFIK